MRRIISVMALVAVGAGCATLQPREGFDRVAQLAQDRTGAQVVWYADEQAAQAVEETIDRLLQQPLSADSAVQVALLNNRNLQAHYEELGIGQAELVQAGLLSNPVLSVLLKFPEAGAGDPSVDIGVSQNFIELLSISLRKKVAAARYEAVQARVAAEIIALSADVKAAFYTLQAAEQMLELHRTILQANEASAEIARRLHKAGNITELALAVEEAAYGQARLSLSRAEVDVVKQREKLITLLGVWGARADLKLAGELPEIGDAPELPDDVEALALQRRVDLQAARYEGAALAESLGLAKQFSWFNDAELEVEAERETDGQWMTGGGVAIPIPLWDTGAAHTSAATGRLRQAVQRVGAMEVAIRSEVRTAIAEMNAARERADYYVDTLLPLRQRITYETQLHYNAMNAGVFELLEARRSEIQASRDHIEVVRDYWLARTALERAVGGRLTRQTEGN